MNNPLEPGNHRNNWLKEKRPGREILFRGIRIDSGEFAYGCLVQYTDGLAAITDPMDSEDDFTGWWVKPETVGQFTGLYDRNAVKIFEGDKMIHLSETPCEVAFLNGAFVAVIENGTEWDTGEWYGMEVVGNIHKQKTSEK